MRKLHASLAGGKAAALVLLLAGGLCAGCGGNPPVARPGHGGPSSRQAREETGLASWYGKKFHGRRTASGKIYDMHAFTAAHRKLPFGTRVRVTNLANGRRVEVTINDRGPFVKGRIIDLSYAAARKVGMIPDGVTRVRLEVLR